MTATPDTQRREPAATTIFVCVSCRRKRADVAEGFDLPGADLARALSEAVADAGATDIAVVPVECLSVCRRPCTIALTAPGKWTYIVGDLDSEAHLADIVTAAGQYAAAPDGIVPWAEKPQTFRSGVVARVPPLGTGPDSH